MAERGPSGGPGSRRTGRRGGHARGRPGPSGLTALVCGQMPADGRGAPTRARRIGAAA